VHQCGLFALLSPLLAGAFVTIIVGAVMLIAGMTMITVRAAAKKLA